MNRYYTLETEYRDRFYRVPKQFMDQRSKYYSMNAMSKILYAILADRNDLSIKNGWVDELNRIYFLFKQDELCVVSGIKSKTTLIKYLKELEKYGLIVRKRVGLKQADRMYLLQIEYEQTVENTLNFKYCNSRITKVKTQELQKLKPNDNNINNTNNIYSSSNRFNNFPQREYSEEEYKTIDMKLMNMKFEGKKR